MAINSVSILAFAILLWVVHMWTMAISQTHTHNSSLIQPQSSLSNSQQQYTLANQQSYGFFTDITNDHWKLAQIHHAKLFPNYYSKLEEFSNGPNDKGKIQQLRNSNKWYGQNFQVEFICPLARRLPSDSMMDGPKWVSVVVLSVYDMIVYIICAQ